MESNTTTVTRLTAKESAAILRKELRKAFPGVKFSVRGDRGTASGYYDCTWTDGPTTEEVQRVCAPFNSLSFNGMTDSHDVTGNTFTVDGKEFRSGIWTVICQREIGEESMNAKIAELRADGWTGSDHQMSCSARALILGCSPHAFACASLYGICREG